MRFRHFVLIVAAVAAVDGAPLGADAWLPRLSAQETGGDPACEGAGSLNTAQEAISRRYKRFEETLMKMADLMRKTDPERAELLRRVIGKSKEQLIVIQMGEIVKRLEEERFGEAIDRQEKLVVELAALLDMLGSEDRAKEIEEEKQRLQDLIHNVDALLGKQKGLRADTERGAGEKGLQDRQSDLEQQTKKLGEKIDRQDQKKAQQLKGDEKTDGEKPDGEKPDGKQSDGKQSDGKQSDGKQSDGKQSDGQKSDDAQQQPQQPSTPGRQEVEQARKAMQDALDKLKESKRDDASQEQTNAIAKLQQAKDRLEEILRQLREEERERLLTKLEDRFQQMLAVQLLIYDNTVPLGKIPETELQTRHVSKATELARKEAELALEAEKALTLLKEEGSSIAFPEAVEQMRDDMRTVVVRLEATKVGELTQGIEQDIIEALEEMIEALQREIERGKSKQQQQQQQQQQKEEELVNKLAELKMLRSLQLRINRSTKRCGRLFDDDQPKQQDVIEQLRILGVRQSRVQRATHDLATGKNK